MTKLTVMQSTRVKKHPPLPASEDVPQDSKPSVISKIKPLKIKWFKDYEKRKKTPLPYFLIKFTEAFMKLVKIL